MEQNETPKKSPSRGCLGIVGWGVHQLVLIVLGIMMLGLTVSNLFASSTIVESCGLVHPVIFEIDVDSVVLSVNDRLSLARGELAFTEPPSGTSEDELPNYWESCVQYWGYVSEGNFRINAYGIGAFATGITSTVDPDTGTETYFDSLDRQVQLQSAVVLSDIGTLMLYLFVPGLVVLLPIITVFLIRSDTGLWWIVMLSLVAAYVLTSALLYISLADVSGISALTDFGTGIFGAVTTGTAIAFMSKGLENFGQSS